MSGWYWLLWVVATVVNFTALWFVCRRFGGWNGVVIFRGRVYRVVEQRWELSDERRSIVAETDR